jgi:hypothetical protein
MGLSRRRPMTRPMLVVRRSNLRRPLAGSDDYRPAGRATFGTVG